MKKILFFMLAIILMASLVWALTVPTLAPYNTTGNMTHTGSLTLPLENDAVTPTLAFGDGDSGIYESTDDVLQISLGGTRYWEFSSLAFSSDATLSAQIQRAAGSATSPTYTFNNDNDTGIGRAAADQLSLIAGGVEAMRFTENTGVIFSHQVTAGITAGTTQTQGQQPLTSSINEISVCANVNDVVTLPSAVTGMIIYIFNNGAQTLQVFPASGDNLGSGVDTSITIAAGVNRVFIAYDNTNWEIMT